MMGNTQPFLPASTALTDVLAILALISDPKAVADVAAMFKAKADEIADVASYAAKANADAAALQEKMIAYGKEVDARAAAADELMISAKAMQADYEARVSALRGLLK
jgi:hypothetical protein